MAIKGKQIDTGENGIKQANMAANSIDSDQYVDGSIDQAHMSADSIDSDQYVDGSIDVAHMSADSVDSDQFVDASIDGVHLAQDAIDTVLQDKFLAGWTQVDTFAGAGTDDVVTSEVTTPAVDDTQRSDADTGLGILSTGGANTTASTQFTNYKVQIRTSSDLQPIDDGAGGEVWAVLSESGAAWTLTYYKQDGSAHTLASVNIDFLFMEVFDLDSLPGTTFGTGPTFGDIASGANDHNHDGRYYTETELDAGQLDNRYYTETELDAGQLDNRYFTESELGAITGGSEGAFLIGTDASAIGGDAGSEDTVQGVLEAFQTAIDNLQAVVVDTAILIIGTDKELASVLTSGDNSDTAINITSTPLGNVMVDVNGVGYTLGDNVTTKDCYFSTDGGASGVVAISAIAGGNDFIWNGAVANFELSISDDIDFHYET